MLHSPCHHVTYQCQLRCITAIHKSSPVPSLDSKVTIVCTPKNLAWSSRYSEHFLTTESTETTDYWVLWIQTYYFGRHILFFSCYIVGKYAIFCKLHALYMFQLRDLVSMCINPDPDQRPDISFVLQFATQMERWTASTWYKRTHLKPGEPLRKLVISALSIKLIKI